MSLIIKPRVFNLYYDVARHVGNFLDIKSTIAFYLAMNNNAYTKHKIIKSEEHGTLLASKDAVTSKCEKTVNTEQLRRDLIAFAAMLSPNDRACWVNVFDIQALCEPFPSLTMGTLLTNYNMVGRIRGKIRENHFHKVQFEVLRTNPETVTYLTELWQTAVLKNPKEELFEFYRTLFNVTIPKSALRHCPWNNTPGCAVNNKPGCAVNNTPVDLFIKTCRTIKDVNILLCLTWQVYLHIFKWISKYQSRRYLNAINPANVLITEPLIHSKVMELKYVTRELFELLYCRFERNTDTLFGKLFDANPDPTKLDNFKRLNEMRVIVKKLAIYAKSGVEY
jgi:hypothetical protein